jgi:hypothetical protein
MTSLQEHGEIAADKARAAGDQNAVWKGRHDSRGQRRGLNFWRLAGVNAPSPKNRRRKCGHNQSAHKNWRHGGGDGFFRPALWR